jgi:hypothetical protein
MKAQCLALAGYPDVQQKVYDDIAKHALTAQARSI